MGQNKQFKSINVDPVIDENQLKADLSYSPQNLSEAMVKQASLFEHYASLASRASRQVDDLKLTLEVREAKVDRAIRDDAAAAGEKVTEASIAKRIDAHPEIVNAKKAINEAKQIEANAKAAAEAFRHRRDMLVQHGLLMREELKGDVSVRARAEASRDVEEQQERVLQRLGNRSAA